MLLIIFYIKKQNMNIFRTSFQDSSTIVNGAIGTTLTQNSTTLENSSDDFISAKDDTWTESSNHLNRSMSGPDCLERVRSSSPEFDRGSMTSSTTSIDTNSEMFEGVVLRKKTGSTAIKRRTGKRRSRTKLKRRCSINGHFYDRETSFFTPPYGSQTSVYVTSLVNTQEVINQMLEKYKVDSDPRNFALFVVRDNGGKRINILLNRIFSRIYLLFIEQKKLKEDDYPLLTRILLGPHEDIARLFLMDSNTTPEVSSEVAQFLNLSVAELKAILSQYGTQEEREISRIKEK